MEAEKTLNYIIELNSEEIKGFKKKVRPQNLDFFKI